MKKIRIGIIICVSLAVLSGAAVAGAKMLETKNAYLTINNDSVSKDELEFYMKASRSDVILRFTSDALSSADKDFLGNRAKRNYSGGVFIGNCG